MPRKKVDMVCVMLERRDAEIFQTMCNPRMKHQEFNEPAVRLAQACQRALSAPPPVRAWLYEEARSAYANPNEIPRKQITRTRRAARILGVGEKRVYIVAAEGGR